MTSSISRQPLTARRVAVIGASTSGLFAATLLAEAGLKVRIYEASRELNHLPRTLIVTSRLVEILGPIPDEVVLNKVHQVEMFSSGASAQITLRTPDLIVERARLIRHLVERALNAGVEVMLGHRFVGFASPSSELGGNLRLQFEDPAGRQKTEEPAHVVVGADGVRSSVLSSTDAEGTGSVALLQARVASPSDLRSDTFRVWFDPGDTRFFYWLIPESDQQAVVGLIADDAVRARDLLASFMQAQRLEPLEFQSSQVAVHHFTRRPWTEAWGHNVMLVGDAAGQVKMTTVGGLVTGLRGARAVADAIAGGKHIRGELRELKRELDLHLLLRRILDHFSDADYDLLLHSMHGQVKQELETHNRDELARAFWRLPLAQPRLMVLAARVLLRAVVSGQA